MDMFTLYRKYRVGITISAQNLRQLGEQNKGKYRETILANCSNKFVFGNNSPEDNAWWEKELGEKREWDFKYTYNTDEVEYEHKYGDALLKYKPNFTAGKIQSLGAKQCYYKVKKQNGKNSVGIIPVDFLAAKYHEPHESKQYNFTKFTNGVVTEESEDTSKPKFDLKNIKYDTDVNGDMNPIKSNETDNNFLLNNDDAIIFDIHKKNDNHE